MGDKTTISWTDATWNPIRGCSKVSSGCANCYAEKVAARFCGPGLPYAGTITNGKWNGKIVVVEDHLMDPLRWKRPRRIFVNSMSDLFHENVSDDTVYYIFDVMLRADRHVFQVLTKRTQRMALFFNDTRRPYTPLPNVWLGTSIENQKTADERLPHLVKVAAAGWNTFVSAEPLLGPIYFRHHLEDDEAYTNLKWVIVGGESGPVARHCDFGWIRSIRDQCKAAGVPCFVKQLGGNLSDTDLVECGSESGRSMHDTKGGDPSEWPKDLRVREWPEGMRVQEIPEKIK